MIKESKAERMMVFEKVYEIYENIIIKTLEQTKTDEEIDEMLDSGSIHDMVLKRLAKALTVAVYRNGKIEDIHAGEYEGPCDFKGIPDSCMKEINIDVCNKMYTMLKMFLSSDAQDLQKTIVCLLFSESCAADWNEPEIDEELYITEHLDLSAFLL